MMGFLISMMMILMVMVLKIFLVWCIMKDLTVN